MQKYTIDFKEHGDEKRCWSDRLCKVFRLGCLHCLSLHHYEVLVKKGHTGATRSRQLCESVCVCAKSEKFDPVWFKLWSVVLFFLCVCE